MLPFVLHWAHEFIRIAELTGILQFKYVFSIGSIDSISQCCSSFRIQFNDCGSNGCTDRERYINRSIALGCMNIRGSIVFYFPANFYPKRELLLVSRLAKYISPSNNVNAQLMMTLLLPFFRDTYQNRQDAKHTVLMIVLGMLSDNTIQRIL